MDLVVATRSEHKLREIRELLDPLPGFRLLDLTEAGVPWTPEEEGVEAFSSFEENAAAKARFFAERSGLCVIADDSGLCVDALDGAPGVFSKRYSGRPDLSGLPLDLANNARLLENLGGVDPANRSGHYVCVVALARPGHATEFFHGTVHGRILQEPRGTGGFGYDPLFHFDPMNATFAEVPADAKNRVSHRAAAVAALRIRLIELQESRSNDSCD
jgi:XTP/dITP diphosphohydrolase